MSGAAAQDGRDVIQLLLRQAGKLPSMGPSSDEPQAEDYNWNAPFRFPRKGLERLNRFVEALAAKVSETLKSMLAEHPGLKSRGLSQHYRREAQSSLPEGEYLIQIHSGQKPVGLLTLPAAKAVEWVERLLGGGAAEVEPDRELSPLENRILREALSDLLGAMSELFQQHGGPALEAGDELHKGACELPDQADEYCRIEMATDAEEAEPACRVVISSDMLDPVGGAQAESGPELPPERRRQLVVAALQKVFVRGRVQLGTARASMQEVMALEPGDVLVLQKSAGDPVDFNVRGRTVLSGQPVQCQGRYAVQVTGPAGAGGASERKD